MKYFKFTEEENKKALEKWGITADDAAKAWQEDPADEDKFMWFMRAIGASKPKNEVSGTYILKPDIMGKLMKIRRNIEEIIEFDEEFDNIAIEVKYDYDNSLFFTCNTTGFILLFPQDNEKLEELKKECSEISISASDTVGRVRVNFIIKDAFIHIPDEKKE